MRAAVFALIPALALLPGAAPAQVPPRSCLFTPPAPIAATHTVPPYPALSVALAEEGVTLLQVRIGRDGVPIDAAVTQSSGSPRLDERAAAFVKAIYRWQAANSACQPAEVAIPLRVDWHLPNASPGAKIPVVDIAPNITDFPPMALEGEEQGVTVVRLSLSPDGQPAGAAIVLGSGSAALDAKAMQLARTGHAWGTPTPDGKPGIVNVVVTWRIPGAESITAVAHNPEWDGIGGPPAAASGH